MTTKPTIVFVPGAWHRPDAFSVVAGQLEAAGYSTSMVSLPSVGGSEPPPGFEKDVEAIRESVQKACDGGQDVILVMHSYGGVPGSESIKGLTKDDLCKDGKTGGVSHLFFCCAFVLPEGVSLLAALGFQDPPWWDVNDNKTVVHAKTPEKIFYNDLDQETANVWIKQLLPMSYKSLGSQVTYAGWRHVPSTYLYCEDDQAIPFAVQKGMVENSGAKFNTETCSASHSPFLSMPETVTAAVRRAAGETVV